MAMKRLSEVELSSRTVEFSSIGDPDEQANAALSALGVYPIVRNRMIATFGAYRCMKIAEKYGHLGPGLVVRIIERGP